MVQDADDLHNWHADKPLPTTNPFALARHVKALAAEVDRLQRRAEALHKEVMRAYFEGFRDRCEEKLPVGCGVGDYFQISKAKAELARIDKELPQ